MYICIHMDYMYLHTCSCVPSLPCPAAKVWSFGILVTHLFVRMTKDYNLKL